MMEDWSDGAKMTLALLVALLVIVVSVYVWNESSRDKVDDIVISSIHDVDSTGNGIDDSVRVGFHVLGKGLSEYEGDGRVDVIYGGSPVASVNVRSISGRGSATIPYSDFVMENGEYRFRVVFGGVTESRDYTVKSVAERLGVHVQLGRPYGETPRVDLTISARLTDRDEMGLGELPAEIAISISVTNPNGEIIYSMDEREHSRVHLSYTTTFVYSEWVPGEHRIVVEVENLMCSEDSGLRVLRSDEGHILDAYPIAVLTASRTQVSRTDNTVTFDGSASFDDGRIVMYSWQVYDSNGDPINPEINPDAYYVETEDDAPDGAFDGKWTHSFGTTYTAGTYTVVLTVTDDSEPVEGALFGGQSSTAEIEITKTLF